MSNAENVAKLVRLINVSIASLSRSRVRVANRELDNYMTEFDTYEAIESTKKKLDAVKIRAKLAEEFRNGKLTKVIKLKKN